mmetsp:Transcript_27140/g.57638  ORF Transcript_27140/g.57638 Transcript_27140/m.57638 type:complete len:529 (-) Transcript_27140:70-1656(-)
MTTSTTASNGQVPKKLPEPPLMRPPLGPPPTAPPPPHNNNSSSNKAAATAIKEEDSDSDGPPEEVSSNVATAPIEPPRGAEVDGRGRGGLPQGESEDDGDGDSGSDSEDIVLWTDEDQEQWSLETVRDYYAAIGLSKSSANLSGTRIRAAYHKLARKLFPGRRTLKAGAKPEDIEAKRKAMRSFWLLTEAFLVLKDPERKAIYDDWGVVGLRKSEACYEESIFEKDAFEVYDAFFSGQDPEDRDFLLMNGKGDDDSESEEEDEDDLRVASVAAAAAQTASREDVNDGKGPTPALESTLPPGLAEQLGASQGRPKLEPQWGGLLEAALARARMIPARQSEDGGDDDVEEDGPDTAAALGSGSGSAAEVREHSDSLSVDASADVAATDEAPSQATTATTTIVTTTTTVATATVTASYDSGSSDLLAEAAEVAIAQVTAAFADAAEEASGDVEEQQQEPAEEDGDAKEEEEEGSKTREEDGAGAGAAEAEEGERQAEDERQEGEQHKRCLEGDDALSAKRLRTETCPSTEG